MVVLARFTPSVKRWNRAVVYVIHVNAMIYHQLIIVPGLVTASHNTSIYKVVCLRATYYSGDWTMTTQEISNSRFDANAALNVFNSLYTGVNVCVLSNGVLLERQ